MNLKDPKLYFNRELSWLTFNDRVIEEAEDTNHPLLERLKFTAIFSSNLDEFFMIRVAGLKEQIAAGVRDIPADGLDPEEQLSRISAHVHKSVLRQYRALTHDILPKLSKKGIRIRKISSLRKHHKHYLNQYFLDSVFPVLTPLAVDPTHPFPQLKGLGLNLMVELRTPYRKDNKIAVVHIPSSLPRFIPLPSDNGRRDFVMVEDLIQSQARLLFPNMKILNISEFRITRNADLDLAEAEADDLLKLVERELRKRRIGSIIRLEINSKMSSANRKFLKKITQLTEDEIYEIPSYLDASAFMRLMGLSFPDLKDRPFNPALNPNLLTSPNIFESLSQGDVLLHHPYDSFQHVVDFVTEAANDPQVLAIKQTLYRTSGDSPIVEALKIGVRNGKQVTALIELKARFDEQNNIEWAKEMDRSGVNVVYGVLGLKTHCKICMVVRKEGNRIRRYLHVSTGNYNAKTAKIYTDLSLMTCDKQMGDDASGLFNLLTGYSMQKKWNKFLIAPSSLREGIRERITEVRKFHSEKHPGRIVMVMNSLVDPDMIRELYKCSTLGIRIDLIIRGICCLKPGIKGISENIQVKSIVGRFLEHTRVFYFKSQDRTHVYMGSADLMQRNLNRRVELVFPIEDAALKEQVENILREMWRDSAKSRLLQKDGTYIRSKEKDLFNVQEFFLKESEERQKHVDTISSLHR